MIIIRKYANKLVSSFLNIWIYGGFKNNNKEETGVSEAHAP